MTDPVDAVIESLGDWRGEMLARIRQLIKQADPEVVEDVKWRKPTNPLGVPTWSHAGIICTGESYKEKVKLTFMRGASISDPNGLFNASLVGVRRAIDLSKEDVLDAPAFTALIREAVTVNLSARKC